jgi:aspartate/methionine/tyrosine aminotransferase
MQKGGIGTHYVQPETVNEFREAVAAYYKRFVGPTYPVNNIFPVAGSSAALYMALSMVLGRGDEILLFEPSYRGHYNLLRDMGVKMNIVELKPENGYHLDADSLEKHVTPQTKAVLVCNPNNPTGTVFTREEIKAVGDLAVRHNLTIFSDEIYLHFVYGDSKFVAPSTFSEYRDRTVNIMSFSKTFSMTGWRLGHIMVPDALTAQANRVDGMLASEPATFVYAAGTACLRGDFKYVEERRREYQARRDYFCKEINDLGYPCRPFEGAFYAWFDARKNGLGSQEWCSRLEKAENVALSPGHTFGTRQDGFIRVPLTQPIPILEDVVDRVRRFSGEF